MSTAFSIDDFIFASSRRRWRDGRRSAGEQTFVGPATARRTVRSPFGAEHSGPPGLSLPITKEHSIDEPSPEKGSPAVATDAHTRRGGGPPSIAYPDDPPRDRGWPTACASDRSPLPRRRGRPDAVSGGEAKVMPVRARRATGASPAQRVMSACPLPCPSRRDRHRDVSDIITYGHLIHLSEHTLKYLRNPARSRCHQSPLKSCQITFFHQQSENVAWQCHPFINDCFH
jgi:hypothetical protein